MCPPPTHEPPTIPCDGFEDGIELAEKLYGWYRSGWAPLQTGARRTVFVDGHETGFFANDDGRVTIDFAEDRYGAQRFANRIIELLEKENDG